VTLVLWKGGRVMPWEVTGPVKERTRFVETYLTGLYTITELAERFGMSARSSTSGSRGTTSTG